MVGGLEVNDALRTALAAGTFDLLSDGKLDIQQVDTLQILVERRETIRAALPPKLASVRCFDHTQFVIRKPYFMLGAARLAETSRKSGRLQFHRENQRFQKGSAEAVSRPTASNSRSCSAHSASVKGRWLLRYSATRWRSAARFSSMLASPADMS